jgi:hypothetical protein
MPQFLADAEARRKAVVPLSSISGLRNHAIGTTSCSSKSWFLCPVWEDKGTRGLTLGLDGRGRCSSGGMFGDMQSEVCGEAAACSPRSASGGEVNSGGGAPAPPPTTSKIADFAVRSNGQKRTSVPKGPQRAYFPSDGLGKSSLTPPNRTEWYVQADLRSGSAPQHDGSAPR